MVQIGSGYRRFGLDGGAHQMLGHERPRSGPGYHSGALMVAPGVRLRQPIDPAIQPMRFS